MPAKKQSIACAAFSLIELLTVIAILLVLLAIAVPATSSVMRSLELSRAGNLVTDELNYARQTAITKNRDVEVRFYEVGSKTSSTDKQYRAVRSFLVNGLDPTKSEPLSRVKYLPEPLIISSSPTYSSLLDHSNNTRSGLTRGKETIPGVSGETDYVSFVFRANGGTNLKPITPPSGNWFVTLYNPNAPVNGETGLPHNFYTAQVDPVTGRTKNYRP